MKDAIIFKREPAEIGVLGTGNMGVRLGTMFARAGRTVVLGSRSPERAQRIVRELALPGLIAGTYEQAVEAKAVLPAIFLRDGLREMLERHADILAGKLLIDISNPYNEDYSDFILPWDTSGAEELQKRLPKVRLVGAFKNVLSAVFDEPLFLGTPSDVLIMGDD